MDSILKINVKSNKNLVFSFSLRCYPIDLIEKFDNAKGDKILLPSSILETISNYNVKWPLIFEVINNLSGKHTHCGVLEFTSDEGCAYLPYWMMQNIGILEGEKLFFRYVELEKGNYIKIQPQSSDFLEISNPKAVLEAKLRNFTCLTKKDVIAIDYNEKIYWLNVIEVKPGNAINIVETDINVDFIPPMTETKSQNLTKFVDQNYKNNTNNSTQIANTEEYEESSNI